MIQVLLRALFLKKEINISPTQIKTIESVLDIHIENTDFINCIQLNNWGNFGCLSFQFGYNDEDSLNWIIQRNKNYYDYANLKRMNLLIIANGDPFTILIDYITGDVFAISSDIYYDKRIFIAPSFELFVQGICTIQYALWHNKTNELFELIRKNYPQESFLFWEHLFL